jgi:ribosomal protein S18 acetylase RimI-like enzyme
VNAELRPARWDDLDAVYALAAATGVRLFGEPELEPEHLRGDWERPSFEVERDARVAVADGAVVGYASLAAGGQVTLWLDPGVAAAAGPGLLELVEAGAPARAPLLVAIVPGGDRPAGAALEAAGYAVAREVWRMEVDLREPPPRPCWPAEVRVRTYRAHEDAACVHELLREAFAGSSELPAGLDDWLPWMTGHSGFDPALWFLAERGGQLAGVALCWRDGFVKDLAVRASERRQGLGEALLRHALAELHRRGVARAALKVDSDNPTRAARLYERVGMRTARCYAVHEKRVPRRGPAAGGDFSEA